MIELIKGKILEKNSYGKENNFIILETYGIGWKIHLSCFSFEAIKDLEEVTLYTYIDESFNLFGFFEKDEKEIFLKLLTTPKVGPKLALSILSCIPYYQLDEIIREKDLDRLAAVPKIGKKTAAYLLFEWRNKEFFEKKEEEKEKDYIKEIKDALVALGCKAKQAEEIAKKTVREADKPLGKIEELIKKSLQYLR